MKQSTDMIRENSWLFVAIRVEKKFLRGSNTNFLEYPRILGGWLTRSEEEMAMKNAVQGSLFRE